MNNTMNKQEKNGKCIETVACTMMSRHVCLPIDPSHAGLCLNVSHRNVFTSASTRIKSPTKTTKLPWH